MKGRMIFGGIASAASGVLAASLLVTMPASASSAPAASNCYFNNYFIYHGHDVAVADNNCYQLHVFDEEADGHGVRAEFYTNQDYSLRTVRDSDGSGSGEGVWSDGVHYVTNFRVCESTKGCSKWVKEIYPP